MHTRFDQPVVGVQQLGTRIAADLAELVVRIDDVTSQIGRADNGMLAAMHVLAEFGHQSKSLSAFAAEFMPYASSGEINSTVSDVKAATQRVRDAFASRGLEDSLDGMTITGTTAEGEAFWWFSVRPSNTEPLLRLNVEAGDETTMVAVRDEVLGLIRL